jgi:hypothetical protein
MELEEFTNRVTAMSEEQMQIAVQILPDTMLWNELIRRYYDDKDGLERVKEALTLPTQALP